jgi:molybdate transport system regulatory protein
MPTPILRIDFNGRRIGPGKMELLEHIIETGSISKAAKTMSMSYRRAWLLIDELNAMFSAPCVETSAGGAGGGGAKVTAFGKRVVDSYRKLEKKLATDVEEGFSGLR